MTQTEKIEQQNKDKMGYHKDVNRKRLEQYHQLESDMNKVTIGDGGRDERFKQRLTNAVRKVAIGVTMVLASYSVIETALNTDFASMQGSYRHQIEDLKKDMPVDQVPILTKIKNANLLYDAERGIWPLDPSQLNSFTPEELRQEGHAIYEQVRAVQQEIEQFYEHAAKNGLDVTNPDELNFAAKVFDKSKGVDLLGTEQSMEVLYKIRNRSDYIQTETFSPAQREYESQGM